MGNGGNDILDGEDGADSLLGGDGDDQVFGAAGNDTLNGDAGNDLVAGGTGDDLVRGGTGDDQVFGDDGNDVVDGLDGNDEVVGGPGDDTLAGGFGDDTLFGSEGDDSLTGGEGEDSLVGQAGSDLLDGDDGKDRLFGIWDGADDGVVAAQDLFDPDVLLGGPGDDEFQLGSGDAAFGEEGTDIFYTGTWVDPDAAPMIFDLEEDEVVIVSVPAGTSADTAITLETDEDTGDTLVQANGQTVAVIGADSVNVSIDQILMVESPTLAAPTSAAA